MIEGLPLFWSIALLLIIWTAAIKDFYSFTIPHIYPLLVIALWVIATVFALTSFLEQVDIIWNLISAITAFFVGFILFAFRLMGGGDVKLFAAIALWIKFSNLHILVTLMILSGLVYTLFYAGWHYIKRRHNPIFKLESRSDSYRVIRRSKIPYGPAIAMGLSAYLAILWA